MFNWLLEPVSMHNLFEDRKGGMEVMWHNVAWRV